MTCYIKCLFYYGFAFTIGALALLSVILKLTTSPYPIIKRRKEERFFLDPITNKPCPFPNLDQPATVDLTVIVPAYNEEERLPAMMRECLKYLSTRKDLKYEVIIVSDGSKDKTVSVAREYSRNQSTNIVRVLELVENRGKGGAIQLGVHSSRGELILFADADGATTFEDFSKLEESLYTFVDKKGVIGDQEALIVGSRAHLEEESIATRSYFRTFLMIGFHWIVWLLCVRGVRDTQCGFKLMTRSSAKRLFSNLHVKRWAFDVELLYIAQYLQIPIKEIAVNWTEIEGSKLVPVLSWLQMLIDLIMIWLRYRIGAWRIKDIPPKSD